jgi:hypothetical protein
MGSTTDTNGFAKVAELFVTKAFGVTKPFPFTLPPIAIHRLNNKK